MYLNTGHFMARSGIDRLILIVGVLALLLVPAFGASAQDDNTLRIGTEPVLDLDPATGANDPEVLFSRLIYDYLIEINADGELVPNLATEWEISEDGLTYTFMLTEGVTFHDGSEFTADDVVFTFNRLQEVGSTAINLLGEFEVTAEDDTTVVFTLPQPNADFLFGIASRFSLILPEGQDSPNVLGEGDDVYANFNGTGPFVLSDYSIEENAVFTANPDYWIEGQPMLDSIEIIFINEDAAQINALRTGTVDFIFKLPIEQIPVLEGEEGLTVLEQPGSTHPVIRLRTDEGSLGEDVRVRQAFKLATDRELLNLDVSDGLSVVGNNDPIAPVFSLFYTPIEDEYDPEAACELLGEAGFVDDDGNPRLEETFYVDDNFNYAVLAQAMAAQWEEACIFVELDVQPSSVYYDTEGNPNNWLDVQLGLTSWGSRPVPQQFLTAAYVPEAPFNESQWDNAEVAELVEQAGVTADIEARAEIYAQISEIFAEEGPIIIPYFTSIFGAVGDRVEGLEMNSFPGRTDFRTVSIGG